MTTWTRNEPLGLAALTDRQREVLGLIAAGHTNPQIADVLGVSLAGVKWHVREVITRLGVATRDDAAEIWREEHSLPRRLHGFLAGVVSFGTLKIVAGTAVASGLVVGSVVVAAVARDIRRSIPGDSSSVSAPPSDDRIESMAAVISSADDSLTDATATAIQLAMEELGKNQVPQKATYNGRRLDATDLKVVSSRFIPAADRVEFTYPRSNWIFGGGRDVWAFELAADGFASEDLGSRLAMSVVFEDGGNTLLARNVLWLDSPAPWVAHYEALVVPLGTVPVAEGQFELFGSYNGDTWRIGIGSAALMSYRVLASPAIPGEGRGSNDLFGVTVWARNGYGHLYGAVSDRVARIDVLTEDGRSATVFPQDPPIETGFPYRVFGASFAGSSWVIQGVAYDSAGLEIGRVDYRDHPTSTGPDR